MSRKKTSTFWKWVAGIATAALATYLAPDKAVSAVWATISRAGTWVLRTLAGPVALPLWVVGLGGLIVLVVVIVCVLAALAVRAKPGASYTDFTNAVVLGIKWTWRWSGNRIDEGSLGPLCPGCDYDLRRIPSEP